jgi:hypothetical protein
VTLPVTVGRLPMGLKSQGPKKQESTVKTFEEATPFKIPSRVILANMLICPGTKTYLEPDRY